MDISTKIKLKNLLYLLSGTRKNRGLLLLVFLFIQPCSAEVTLSPYTATYTSRLNGFSAELKRHLKKSDNNQWSLSNKSTILFSDFEERSSFFISDNRLKSINYHYKNPLSSKRNSSLRFDWENKKVTETKKKSSSPLDLSDETLDKLTFQVQLRLDLMNQGSNFKDKTYHLVEGNRLKLYTITYLGEETITTPAGTFTAAKIKQQRPGKDKHTLIWLAKDWQYFILKIERFEKEESRYKLELQSASLGGRNVAAIKP